jgi:hypothetical protein
MAIVDLGDSTETVFHLVNLRFFDTIRKMGPAHFNMGVAGGFLRRRVPGHDGSIGVGGDDKVSGTLNDAGEMQLHPPHFLAEP